MKKIDLHVHSMLPPHWDDCGPLPLREERHSSPEELRAHLESQGIVHAVLLSGGEVPDGMFHDMTNNACREISEKHPDFYSWMCNISPEVEGPLGRRLEICKQQGAIGIGELMINQWLDSPILNSLFDVAEALDLPVTIHMSPEPGFNYGVCDRPGLPLLEETLKKHPKLKILGHSQPFWLEISGDCPRIGNDARNQWGKGPVTPGGRVPFLFENYPNLYGDLSAFSGSCAILRDEAFGLAFLERFSDRLFFATDSVDTQQKFPLGQFLDESVQTGKLSLAAYENICFRNAHRVFQIPY